MPDRLLATFDRGVPAPMPAGVRNVYRAGTPKRCPEQSRKALIGLGLGLPGAHVAVLHAPWLLVCLGAGSLSIATCHAGRSATVPHKEPGRRPGAPANGTHAPRVRSCVLYAASGCSPSPAATQAKPDRRFLCPAIPTAAYHSGQCMRSGVFGAPRMSAFIRVSPIVMATHQMEAKSLFQLAYEPPRKAILEASHSNAPGWLFDLTVIALAIMLGMPLLF